MLTIRQTVLAAGLSVVVASAGISAGFLQRIHAIPYEEMDRMRAIMTTMAGGANTTGYSPDPAPSTRVVRNNPDTRTVYCWADLSGGPVRISGPLPVDDYWSISVYTPDSLNPVVVSDRELGGAGRFDFILAAAGEQAEAVAAQLPDGAQLAQINASEAAVLLRYFLPTKADQPALDAIRRAARCASLNAR
ncbi:MAG: DUF1254 domain-containing protein [Pseudomonadota bacterium]